jgi:hypothetical protein
MSGTFACFLCGRELRTGTRRCPACGGNPVAGAEEAQERLDSAHLLNRALETLGVLRLLFIASAVVTGLLAVLLSLLLGAFGKGWVSLPVAYLGACTLVAGVAAWDVVRHPLPWSLAFALLETLTLFLGVLGVVTGKTSPVGLAVTALLAGGGWYAVVLSSRMKEILRRHPGLFAARRLLGAGPAAPSGSVSRKLREKGREETRIARRRLLIHGGGAAVSVLLLGAGLHAWMHPAPEPAMDGFRTAWNTASWKDLAAGFDPPSRERLERGISILLRRRGWYETPPPIGEPSSVERTGERVRVLYAVPGGELRADWELRDRRWILTGMRFPER